MGFLEWLGVKSYKPDYSEAMKWYERLMDTSSIDKQKALAMQDWRDIQKRAFGDIERSVGARWGGTGADVLGITSSLPGEWSTQAGTRWMQDVGNPMARNIESEWLAATQQQQQMAQMTRLQLEEQARAEAAARTGAGMGLVGTLAGAGIGALFGNPAAGASLGGTLGGQFGGGGQDTTMGGPYSGGGGYGAGAGGYNPYLDWRYLQNMGNPIYYPSGPSGGGGWNG